MCKKTYTIPLHSACWEENEHKNAAASAQDLKGLEGMHHHDILVPTPRSSIQRVEVPYKSPIWFKEQLLSPFSSPFLPTRGKKRHFDPWKVGCLSCLAYFEKYTYISIYIYVCVLYIYSVCVCPCGGDGWWSQHACPP